MKKVVLTITLLSMYSFGYTVTNEFWVDSTGSDRNKQINITCNNGQKGYIYYFPHNNGYYAKNSNNRFSSMNSAVSKLCKGKKSHEKRETLLQDSVVCKTQKQIKKALKGNLSYTIAQGGGYGCFSTNRNISITILKKYSGGSYSSTDDNGKQKQYQRIDDYFKIKDGGNNIFYVRKSDVK